MDYPFLVLKFHVNPSGLFAQTQLVSGPGGLESRFTSRSKYVHDGRKDPIAIEALEKLIENLKSAKVSFDAPASPDDHENADGNQ